jgi:hypothetical protein
MGHLPGCNLTGYYNRSDVLPDKIFMRKSFPFNIPHPFLMGSLKAGIILFSSEKDAIYPLDAFGVSVTGIQYTIEV